jgi:tetratricopeptide (TPR) repeat protein
MAARTLRCYPDSLRDAGPSSDPEIRAEQRWVRLAESVDCHRRLGANSALDITSELLADRSNGERSIDFLTRLYYAHARHLQKAGRIPEAREAFSTALDYAEKLSVQTATEPGRPRLRYAHQIVSQIQVQLARILIARSQLRQGRRLLATAGALEAGMNDPINVAFIDLQKGSVLRQLHQLDEAVTVLEGCAKVFRRERHHRYLMRCQYELAKAYLNRGELPNANVESDLRKAREVLVQRGQMNASHTEKFVGDPSFADRFETSCDVLSARILLRLGQIDAARHTIDKAFDRLTTHPLAGTSRDLVVLGTWVKGNILIEQGCPSEAISLCLAWANQRNRREPVDRTDDAWVDLVLWKAYVHTDALVNAEEYRRRWHAKAAAIENVYIQAYATQVAMLHINRFDSAFIVNAVPGDAADHWNVRRRKRELTAFLLRRMVSNYGAEGLAGWSRRLGLSKERVTQLFDELNIEMPTRRPKSGGPSPTAT